MVLRHVHLTLAFCVAALASGCGAARPPRELDGLWSAGPAACAAGVGVKFERSRIVAVYGDQPQVLFSRPDYQREAGSHEFRVRIVYRLPRLPGGAGSAGAHGVLVLAQNPAGDLAPASHNLIDTRTGSARLRMVDDPALRSMALTPCDGPPPGSAHGAGLRGRAGG